MIEPEYLEEFKIAYPNATVISEGGFEFIYIPKLTLPEGNVPAVVEALLCPQMRDGYMTRLFFSTPFPNKGANWTEHQILGKKWHSWSWQNVQANRRLTQILLGHLAVFR